MFQLSILGISLFVVQRVRSKEINNSVLSFYQQSLVQNRIKSVDQTLCYSENDKNIFFGKDLKQNPASLTKLFTTYWGLKNFGAHYRFKTKLYIENKNLYLRASGDPYLLSEQLILLVSKLASNNFQVYDNLYLSNNLLLDWGSNKNKIKRKVKKIFNPHLWDQEIIDIIKESSMDHLVNLKTLRQIKVNNVIFQDLSPRTDPILTLASPPLYRSLKEVNKYSNNFYFDNLLGILGGSASFNQFIATNLKINRKDFHFYTGSGLGENSLKCSHILKLFSEILTELPKNQIELNHLLPIAGVDRGTLENRMKAWPGSSWAKTGSLPRQGHSAIAGITKRSTGYEFFVFLNRTHRIQAARNIQDQTLEAIYQSLGDVIMIDYDINELDIMRESQVL